MKRTEQKVKREIEKFLNDNKVFFSPFKEEYYGVNYHINEVFGENIPKFRLAEWSDLNDDNLREKIILLGGRMTAMRKSFPVKFINYLLKYLEMNISLLRLAEHCYYFFQYQEIFTNGDGNDISTRFKNNFIKWKQDQLDSDAKDKFFSICSELRQSMPTNHLKSYGKYLFGASYDDIQIIMLDCYRQTELLEDLNSGFNFKGV